MTIWQAFILGIIQGLTEFLPISSSGHLVIAPFLLGWSIPEEQVFTFDVLVQMGTLIAVILYFWKYLWKIVVAVLKGILEKKPFGSQDAKLGWLVVLSTIPAILGGLFLKDQVEAAFQSVQITAIFLLITALLLWVAERLSQQVNRMEDLSTLDAFIIGCFQVLAIFPGLSRSGSTISGGILRKLKREEAAKFSFLMSIPVMLGAGVMSMNDLIQVPDLSEFLPVLLVGLITSAVVGFLSIHWLLKFLNNNKLGLFSIYCVGISILTLVVNAFRG
ncbi:MAG: undecaprenyl-diphosphatase UppP [Anaerolineaceae bacterium]|jgi:undecaprenyl-diphosphatase|nr:undecaprenyl-diphosphatase UppP [Anaerolineaceae bacterium]